MIQGLRETFESGVDIFDIERGITAAADEKVIESVRASDVPFAVLALGGYGRTEMSPHSDVDLLFLYREELSERAQDIVSVLVRELWGKGLECSGATRTINDCKAIFKEGDVRAQTSMLEARFVAGDNDLYNEFVATKDMFLADAKWRKGFITRKIDEHKVRLKKFGGSVYLLEPHVKEGEGGLRECHSVSWLARFFYSAGAYDEAMILKGLGVGVDDLQRFKKARKYIEMVRFYLHLLEGKRLDRLVFEHQGEFAKCGRFCIEGSSHCELTVDRFMGDYYRQASIIHNTAGYVIDYIENHGILDAGKKWFKELKISSLIGEGKEVLLEDVMKLMREVASGAISDGDLRLYLTKHGIKIGNVLSEKVVNIFFEIISGMPHTAEALSSMQELGVLKRIIPEFESIKHWVQHDAYHLYTVDQHTFKALGELSALLSNADTAPEFKGPAAVARSLKDKRVLALAILLHDIGKGLGGGHGHKGAVISREISRRLGFNADEIEKVYVLIESHLLLPKLAFNRDIADPQLIEHLSSTIKERELLDMLYVLTFCDLRAIGEGIWSKWKERLLDELYTRVRSELDGVGADTVAKARGAMNGVFDDIQDRYFISNTHDEMMAHAKIYSQMLSEGMSNACGYFNSALDKTTHLIVLTRDKPGILSRIVGVVSESGLSILEAQLNTSRSGLVLDVLKLTGPSGYVSEDKMEHIKVHLLDVLSGGSQVVGVRRKAAMYPVRKMPADTSADVHIDNDVSALCSVVDVNALDRIGLLYDIADTLFKMGYNIDMAKILTRAGHVTDSFYIRKLNGHKVSGVDETAALKNSILSILHASPKTI